MERYWGQIAYLGKNLAGWQKQSNAENTVQAYLEKAVFQITDEKVKITGAGRTDAGVHAQRQVFHFDLKKPQNQARLLGGINAIIPREMSVLDLEVVSTDFHSLRDAKEKWYRYRILNRRMHCPFRQDVVLFYPQPLEVGLIQKAAKYLQGEHDFSSFCASGTGAKTMIRNLKTLEIKREGDEIILDFQAPGFLYKMVRNITGTLLDVGRGKIEPEEVSEILKKKDRRAAGPTAPAFGLTLMRIFY